MYANEIETSGDAVADACNCSFSHVIRRVGECRSVSCKLYAAGIFNSVFRLNWNRSWLTLMFSTRTRIARVRARARVCVWMWIAERFRLVLLIKYLYVVV